MPPKKKGKKGAKDAKKKGAKEGDLTETEKLKLKTHEIDSLKDNLAFRKDFSRKSKAAFEELKERLEDTNTQIEEISSTHKASNAYLTHQYKTLQNEMAFKVHELESELLATRKKLEETEAALRREREERSAMSAAKDSLISELTEKNRKCQQYNDSILQMALDEVIGGVEAKKRASWEKSCDSLQARNKVLLAELGLRIHDIWARILKSLFLLELRNLI